MNILDARILLKRSTVNFDTPSIPASSSHTDGTWTNTDIYSGETFLNVNDQRMYIRAGANIKEFAFQNHWAGQSYGGVVFHTWRDALNMEHGLAVSVTNISGFEAYSNITGASVGSTRTWDGQYNTNLMTAQSGASSGAWLQCNNYTYFGYNDWYLPSIDELNLLFNNRFNVNKTLQTIGGSDLLEYDGYWSSTQQSISNAYWFDMSNGSIAFQHKSNTLLVRAIRQF